MPHRELIDIGIAGEFLSRSFAPSETIAIVLRSTSPATIVQRIVTLERVLQPRYLGRLAHENATEANIYFGANPVVSGSRKRIGELARGKDPLKLTRTLAAFVHGSADDVVDKALNYVFAKDRDFQDYLKSSQATKVLPSLRGRRLGTGDGAEPAAN